MTESAVSHSIDAALERLKTGNKRFQQGVSEIEEPPFSLLDKGQDPHVVVVACSDSRSSPELVFDCPLGELFVIRVAGNVVSTTQLASIEYALTHFSIDLVVILGHSHCGAIDLCLEALKHPDEPRPESLKALAEHISPHIAEYAEDGADACAQKNAEHSAMHLLEISEVARKAVDAGETQVIPAFFELASGAVSFSEPVTAVH